ncbi:MAG: TonB-dependent receptor [Prevotella sp.]|nr:TonB-dependent receptor [Prevotella sp.]
MYKPTFNQRKAIRFRHFTRKGYALFSCLGKVVTIGVLSVATLQSATAASRHLSTDEQTADTTQTADKEAALDDVEVTGQRAPLAIGQAARMVTVLSREDIQAAPVQSINDLLKMAAAVDVRQRGPIGAQTDIGIRGATHEQITILLNGINICDPQTGHNAFDPPCDVADIVRIEVLEGPAGRVYGTSSLVGAINIVTAEGIRSRQQGGSSSVQARIEGGSFGYSSAAGRISLTSRETPLYSSLSASYTRSDGYSRSKAGALNSDYSGAKAFLQGGYAAPQLRLRWHAGLSTRGFGSNTFYSAKFDEQFEHTTKLSAALQGETTTGPLHIRTAVNWNRGYDRFELIRGSEERVAFNHHRTDVFGISTNSWFDWAGGRTAIGAELRNEDIVSGNLGEELNEPHGNYKFGLNRTNLSLHMEHNILLSRLTLSAGFVAVKNTWCEMPLTVYPGIDASMRLGRQWKLYASYNSSLRMPSFTELYYSVGGHKADKYLKPEELQAVEGGAKYDGRRLSAKTSIFYHHSRNMIDWVMDSRESDPVWQSVNLTKVNTLGQEIEADYQLDGASLHVAYCHLHQQKDVPSYMQSQYSLEYLRHKLTARLCMQLTRNLDLALNYRWQDRMGSYTDTEGQSQAYRPYSIVDARLSWNASSYSVYAEGNNLLSHRYVDYGNVRQPGMWITVGAKIKLTIDN